jgi:hypothetical protein
MVYPCKHTFCLRCIYKNRFKDCVRNCPLCRTTYKNLTFKNSPIFKIPEGNYEEMYKKFMDCKMCKKIDNSNLTEDLKGKYIVIETSRYIEEKNIQIETAYIGLCNNVIENSIEMSETYYVDKDEKQFYPTSPFDRKINIEKYNSVFILY